MRKNVLAIGVATAGAMIVTVLAVMAATNTVQDDVCSAAHRECAAMASGLMGTVDCRIEVYHCRSAGHFEFPDGTVREFPATSADIGQD